MIAVPCAKDYGKATYRAQEESGKRAPLTPSLPGLQEPRTQGAERKGSELRKQQWGLRDRKQNYLDLVTDCIRF